MHHLTRAGASTAALVLCWLGLLALPALGFLAVPAAAASLSWSGPTAVDPQASGVALERVACPAVTQCTAVDARGQEVTFNPHSPQTTTPVMISGHTLSGVACPSTTQCTAVDVSGQEVTFNPQSSSAGAPTAMDSGGLPLWLVCPTETQCTTVDAAGQAVTFNPQSGQAIASAAIDPGRVLVAVDCPGGSTTHCAALDSGGGAVLFDPQSPTAQTPTQVAATPNASPTAMACRSDKCIVVDNAGTGQTFGTQGAQPQPQGSGPIDQTSAGATAVSGVACPSDTECTAVDVHGGEATFNPTFPISAAVPIDANQTLSGIACPSASQCTAVDRNGQAVTFDPSSPSSPTLRPVDGHTSLSALSCPSTGQCTAVDVGGTEVSFTPGSSASPSIATVDAGTDGVYAVACPDPTQCTAVDNRGQEVTFNPQSPGSPKPTGIDSNHALFALACPASTQCTAVDDAGGAVTFNPQAPGGAKPATVDSGHGLTAVACPSAGQCSAVDDRGAEVTFKPAAPGTPVPFAIDQVPATALACPTSTQCTAVDGAGDEVTFNPAAPGQASALAIDQGSPLTAIACRTATGCVAVDQAGRALEGDPSGVEAWSVQPISGNALADIACPSAVQCVAVDQPGNAFAGSSEPLPAVPAALSRPLISGLAGQGRSLSERHARWSNGPTSYTYQWRRCNAAGRRCSLIRGATGQTYSLSSADVGHRIQVQEVASNITGGGAPTTSAVTAAVHPALVIVHAALSGISSGRPRLTFTLRSGTGGPPLERITVSLPAGLSLRATSRGPSVAAKAGHRRLRMSVSAHGRTLTITLRKLAGSVGVAINGLTASPKLQRASRARRPVTLIVVGTVSGGSQTRLIVKVRGS